MTAPVQQCQPEAAAVRQPTATPWRIHSVYPAEIFATVDEKRFMVADISGAGSQGQDEANAAFIVEAVNSHAAFKKALQWIADNEGAHPHNVAMVARDALAVPLEQSGSGK